MNEESVREALHRRAVGYATDEIVEEYSVQDGEETLVRRRVTKKEVPPDISAAKLLLEEERPLCELSDEDGFDVNRCVSDREYRHGVLLRAITSRNERRNELAFACLDGSAEENGEYLRAYLQSVLTSACSKHG